MNRRTVLGAGSAIVASSVAAGFVARRGTESLSDARLRTKRIDVEWHPDEDGRTVRTAVANVYRDDGDLAGVVVTDLEGVVRSARTVRVDDPVADRLEDAFETVAYEITLEERDGKASAFGSVSREQFDDVQFDDLVDARVAGTDLEVREIHGGAGEPPAHEAVTRTPFPAPEGEAPL
ncbi:hypothetical protein [Halopiger goleimassiliensis]|uniref:hypothetical protein n=1 Tax=Halopiger goleimassiliensis TaxID=1293048 RepID=UPI000677B9B5|nr:hypothetical protein [Halopiger goleimassiliensis]